MPQSAHNYSLIFKAWLVAGTLDILAACGQFYLVTHRSPIIVLQYVSSAVLGDSAYSGSVEALILGLLFHFMVALLYTVLFFLLASKFKGMLKHKIITAIVYGIFMWAFMQFTVLPFTHVKQLTVTFKAAVISILILVACISTPLIYFARKANRV